MKSVIHKKPSLCIFNTALEKSRIVLEGVLIHWVYRSQIGDHEVDDTASSRNTKIFTPSIIDLGLCDLQETI